MTLPDISSQPPGPAARLAALPAPLEQLQLDLAGAVARLRQVRDEFGGDFGAAGVIGMRVLTCDLPRLEKHLTDEARAFIEAAQ